MPQEYYPEMGGGGPPPKSDGPPPERPMKDKRLGESALLPKSIIGDKELRPGDEITMKVMHVYDDEVEVCCTSSESEEGETESEDGMMNNKPTSVDEEIDGMNA